MCANNTFLQNNVSKFSKSVQQTCKLSSIAKVERGKFSIRPRNNPAYYGGYMPFVQTGDISASNKLLMKYSQTLNNKGVSVSKIFPAGTILITIAANIGDVAITIFPVACPDSVVGIAAKKCNMHWLYYVLNSKKHILNALATQNAQKNINLEILNSLKIKTSPLPEQEKIAEILSCWDDAIEQLTDLIAEQKQQKKALMQRLLTGKQRLPGFTKPWKNVRLGEISDLYQPQTISQRDLEMVGYPVYGANGLIGYYHLFNHETWQIMITCRGSTCGTVNRTYGKSWITGNAMVVNVDKYKKNDKQFLFFKLLNENFLPIVSGSGQPQIVRAPLEKWKIYIPADINEQKAIADILITADAEIDLLNQKLDVFKEQKKGLMQKLLTGQIRVKVDKK